MGTMKKKEKKRYFIVTTLCDGDRFTESTIIGFYYPNKEEIRESLKAEAVILLGIIEMTESDYLEFSRKGERE